jgi:stage V sporulation protein SpoVS
MIYKFNEYKNFNKVTLDFIHNKITESEFINYLNGEVLNEGLIDSIKDFFGSFKQKVVDIFWSFVVKSYEIGFAIWDKLNVFIKWLFGKINSFADKHPTLWRVMIITIVILIILIVTASSAHAQTKGEPIPLGKINMAIGWLDNVKSSGTEDPMLVSKAMAHLVDLRDGHMDIQGLGDGAIKMADAALNTASRIIAESKTSTDSSFFRFCTDLMQKGSEYVGAAYTKSGGLENIKLAVK